MKVLRFVLILVVLFTFFVSPVQAQSGERYGFIPLVKKANLDLPLWVQSQDAFERLRPQLMRAKKNGAILEFEPEFGLGVVKIKYVLGTNGLMLGRETIFDDVQDAVASMPHVQVTGAQPEVIDTPVFNIGVWGNCMTITAWPNSDIVGNMQDQAGVSLIDFEREIYSGGTMTY